MRKLGGASCGRSGTAFTDPDAAATRDDLRRLAWVLALIWLALALLTALTQRYLGWRLAIGLIGGAGALFTLGILIVAAGSLAAASIERQPSAPIPNVDQREAPETSLELNVTAAASIVILVLGLAGIAVAGFIVTPPVAWPPSRASLPRLAAAAALLAIVLAGLYLHIRRHAALRLTAEGLEVPTSGAAVESAGTP